jgi:hypothetical protein
MEIVQNLWQVGGGDLTAPEDAAIYPIIFVTIRFMSKSRPPAKSIL